MNGFRVFLLLEGLGFTVASRILGGAVIASARHSAASIAESVIAAALLAGCAATLLHPRWTRAIAIAAQALAAVGIAVVVFVIARHLAPRGGYGAMMLAGRVADFLFATG